MQTGFVDARSQEWEMRTAEPYYMGDSIEAIPATIQACLEHRLLDSLSRALGPVKPARIYCVGTGTSYNVCEAIAYICRKILQMPVEACSALDFELDTPLGVGAGSLVIALSHSGNTLATGLAVEKARQLGAFTVGISAVSGSRLPLVADFGLIDPNPYEGRPRGKTRSYHSSILLGVLAALSSVSPESTAEFVKETQAVGESIARNLQAWQVQTREMAQAWSEGISRYMLAGFGVQKSNADEFGLKLVEVLGENAVSYSLEELTHGPGASFRQDLGVILFQTDPRTLRRCLEIARGVAVSAASLLVVTDTPEAGWPERAQVIGLRETLKPELLGVLPAAAAAQCFLYYLAIAKGMNPDTNCLDKYPELAEVAAIFFPPGTH